MDTPYSWHEKPERPSGHSRVLAAGVTAAGSGYEGWGTTPQQWLVSGVRS
jgi:hypothetical protein